MKHTVEKTRREYNQWVADETLEDYALRYSPSGFRKWSPLLLANTALGGISFLALEAIGAVLLLNYGFSNAFWAIMLASLIIFIAGFPISYYAARYNIDIDLLTRSAGFGYVGSTVTSLIYASFCFIFFALEAAIMAQALKLYFDLPLAWGYLLCSLIIIPIVFYGVTAINQLHRWTQPIWLLLMILPFYFVFQAEPKVLEAFIRFEGSISGSNNFDWYYFGIATGISFSLIAQIGEQVDYLRFMPNKQKSNRMTWWVSLIAAGPGWIVLGCLKQLGGAFLASLVVMTGLGLAEAKEPVQMYLAAYDYVFDSPSIALLVTTVFVIISQIKINVTNAYAGSLAWSNFFSRVTHSHPGRVVWLIFNIGIALLLMELGVFEAINKILGLYSNVAVAWIFAVFADLVINKPLKLSPSIVEFKRAHLYDFNPVGFVSMLVASFVSILAFSGLFGEYAQAYSWLFALLISLILSPLIAIATKGKYYIARDNEHFSNSDDLVMCGVCEQDYAETDMAHCPFHEVAICSLCCTLESNCRDQCKPSTESFYHQLLKRVFKRLFKQAISDNIIRKISNVILVSGSLLSILGFAFWLVYSDMLGREHSPLVSEQLAHLYTLFGFISILVGIASWWIILANESSLLAETELNEQNEILDQEIKERKQVESELRSRTDELALHNDILQLIGEGTQLKYILKLLVQEIERLHPKMLCSILLLDVTAKYLKVAAAPSFPDFYNQAIDGIKIGESVGSCGAAAFSKKQVIVENIQQHPYWQAYRELARKAGLASCWSRPIFNSNTKQVLGAFAIYHHQPSKPTAIELEMIKRYTNLAALAIEQDYADQELRIAANAFEVQEGIFVTDANAVILKVNKAFSEITGYSAEEAIGHAPSLLKSLKQNSAFYKAMWQEIHTTGDWQGEIWNRRKNGVVYPEWLKIMAVKDSGQKVTHYVASFTDITLRKQSEEKIQQLAYYDPLTNLPNRRYFQTKIEESIARANRNSSQFAVLMLDLDRFKVVNDTLGHLAGDELLQQVAQR
ncbi:MAG: diguanylate cyclase, partial [Methyloprofundus sp.]|nr:diguanylate cyclase [Methyloprofundus sp.]